MSLLDVVSRRGARRLAGVMLATLGVSVGCVGVASAVPAVIRTIPVGGSPIAVSADGTHVWVTSESASAVSEIEPSSGTVIRTISVGYEPTSVSSDGTHVWVANEGASTVSEIEASSGAVIRTISVGDEPTGVSSDGTHVWVADDGAGTVSEIEASSGKVIRTISVGGEPYGVSSDGTHVWVTNLGERAVSEIEASSGKVIRTISVGDGTLAVSSDGTHVWVTNGGVQGEVSEIEVSSGTVIRTIPVGGFPWGVSSDGTHVWVANAEVTEAEPKGTVSEIQASSGAVIHTIPVGVEPFGVSSDGIHVWVANAYEDTVSEIRVAPAECSANRGTITLKPGLTNTPSVQNVTIDGSLEGCTGEPFTKATYTATMKTQNAVSCAVLEQEERVEGPAKFKWTPKAKASTGRLLTALFEGETVGMFGEVLSGSYSPLTFSSEEMIEVFSGGGQCGEPHGKKAAKAVKKGTFEGATVSFDE
jgi:YVTN family beta-propeller protein